ncbi:hypothetical protein K461DRAFT_310966 [Myriangium duriaei CBS 260.36]|uniref:F-box domain-containing protein n=1 Tax=Myriangium duriaei CBS 260.36 TaxID=1168546 RepID=A0A9P4MPA6_9PEZI|nr:hypothetical protein K461DRAFT_310966 [Myriangium duriaei CBS 260.36]
MANLVSTFIELPRELLDRIATHLTTNEFNTLRLTCKTVENKLLNYWSNAFFTKRQFMIDRFSLQTLVNISEHPILSKSLKHLVIGLNDLTRIATYRLTSANEFRQALSAVRAQQALLDTGEAIELLSKAVGKLPSLETVGIRDFDSPTRYRDSVQGAPTACWRSYGASQYSRWPQEGPPHHHQQIQFSRANEFISRVCRVVMSTLIRCPGDVHGLEIMLRRPAYGLRDEAFIVSPTIDVDSLSLLTKLHLDLAVIGENQDHMGLLRPAIPESALRDISTMHVRRLLKHTPNVTWLRLNFTHWSSEDCVTAFISWLARRPDGCLNGSSSLIDPEPANLHLRRLDLGGVVCGTGKLRELVAKFSSLHCLSLRNFCLTGLSDGENPWSDFVAGLSAHLPDLKRFELRSPRRRNSEQFEISITIKEPVEMLSRFSPSSIVIESVNKASLKELAEKMEQQDLHSLHDDVEDEDEFDGEGGGDDEDEDGRRLIGDEDTDEDEE